FPLYHAWKAGAQLVGAEVGEEAEPAEVDAEYRSLPVPHLPPGAEDGTVAAEDEGDVGRHLAEVALLAQVDGYDLAVLLEKRQQPVGFFSDPRTSCVAQDENAHDRFPWSGRQGDKEKGRNGVARSLRVVAWSPTRCGMVSRPCHPPRPQVS